MFIAHLPAGYLLAKRFCRDRSAFFAVIIGAIAPDLDLAWWALVDGGQVHHHRYWTHVPLVWLVLGIIGAMLWVRTRRLGAVVVAFAAGAFVHVVLDSLVGDIMWLAPWSQQFNALAHVPAQYAPWWVNFLLHWSFLIEVIIVTAALGLRWHSPRKKARVGRTPVCNTVVGDL